VQWRKNFVTYQLPKPFNLSQYSKVFLDIETTGFDMYKEDDVIGISVGVEHDERTCIMRYYPVKHLQGPNYKAEDIYAWLRHELRGKTVVGHNIGGFDLPFLRAKGLDLVKHNSFIDTMHGAILYDPAATSYALDAVAKRFLGSDVGKIGGLDKDRLATYHPQEVGAYAEQDTRLCWMLEPVLYGHLRRKDLLDVFDLECKTIRPVVEMQANGLLFDHAKASQWIDLARKDLAEVERTLGSVNYNSPRQVQAECDKLGIIYPWNWQCPTVTCEEAFPSYMPEEGKTFRCWKCQVDMVKTSPHFGKKFVKKMEHPFVKQVQKAKQLHKLLNTFLVPWVEHIDPANPILRYTLNQLRDRDEHGGNKGAVSGRFSCAGMGAGAQPQQIWSVENQEAEIGPEYLLRSLIIPEPGKMFASLDASQIEFRLFAHYSENADLIREYNENPKVDFHQLVAEKVLKGLLPRKKAKNVNFGTLYNMGVAKFARELGIPQKEAEEMFATYNQYFPAAKQLRDREKRKAACGIPTITLKGRRFDWDTADIKKKCYVALNRLIQGSAADIMKLALVKAYDGGYFDKMRLTVHDEVDGDITKIEQIQDLKRDLEDPKFLDNIMRVPLVWEPTVGPSWSGR
jgi:DNA polymerase-1